MEPVYAALLLTEANEELNETNLTSVLDAAGCAVDESRVKALVAALEGVDVEGITPDDGVADETGGRGRIEEPSDGRLEVE